MSLTRTTNSSNVVAVPIGAGTRSFVTSIGCQHDNIFGLIWKHFGSLPSSSSTPTGGKQGGFWIGVGPTRTNGTFSVVAQASKRIHVGRQRVVQSSTPNVGIVGQVVRLPRQVGQGYCARNFHRFIVVGLNGEVGILRFNGEGVG